MSCSDVMLTDTDSCHLFCNSTVILVLHVTYYTHILFDMD